jgi:putative radical SAM enzyme (TIGR03279 family)
VEMVIQSVAPDSPAALAGLRPGDQILTLNGHHDLEDLLDYQFEVSGIDYLALTIRRTAGTDEFYRDKSALDSAGDGANLAISFAIDPDEPIGLTFTRPIFTDIKTCVNACPFCFIDQQPEGLRPSLYVKDDDYRLSYFNNTYITLTNLSANDRRRIETLRPGPLYVSVHATVPEVRERLLVNRKAGLIMDELRWLAGLEIPFHAQVVICPGINDGNLLTQTLHDLRSVQPACQSVAVVPVGLTQYRGHLPDLVPVDGASAAAVIERVAAFRQDTGTQDWVFLSDEFYYKAGQPLPQYGDYADFPQLEDGVGTARMLLEGFYRLEPSLPKTIEPSRNVLVLTGKLAAMTLLPIVARLNQIEGLYVDCMAVESQFWGQAVDVAGLITGGDIRVALQKIQVEGYAFGVIPGVMLKSGTTQFLDDLTVEDLVALCGLPIRVVRDPYNAQAFVSTVLGP